MVVVMRMEAVVVTINGMVVVLIVQLLQLFVQTNAQIMVSVLVMAVSVTLDGEKIVIVQFLNLFLNLPVQTIAQVMVYVIKRLESVIVIVNGKVAMIVL